MLGRFLPLAFCLAFLVLFFILFVLSLCKKDFGKNISEFFGVKKFSFIFVCLIVGVFFGAGISSVSFCINNNREFENGNYQCSGLVSEIVEDGSGCSILVKDVTINEKACNTNFKLAIYFTQLEVGDRIVFDAHLYQSSIVQDGAINTYILKNNIKYYGYVDESTLTIQSGEAKFTDKLKDDIKTILLENMSAQNAGISYATICGDKTLIDDKYYQIFQMAGLAHILAVSGLHVGFLVGLLLFVLRLFKLKNKHKFFIVALALFGYCFLCGFSPSIVRASIMSLCLLLGMILGERNDVLSNISLSGIIILSLQPLYLYDVGFLLSFGSVFGILLLSKSISKALSKIKLPKFLCDLIAVTLSATLGTIPAVFSYFGEISIMTIVSNLLVLPLFSIMFVVLLVSTLICLIFHLGFMISFAEFFVNVVTTISSLFAKVDMIKTFNFDVLSAIIYYFGMFVISPYFLLKQKSKFILCFAFMFCLSPYLILINVERQFDTTYAFVSSSVENTLFLSTKTNQKILVNVGEDEYDLKNLKNSLKNLKVKNLDYLMLFNYEDDKQGLVRDFADNFNIKNIIVFGELNSSTKVGLANNVKNNNLTFCEEGQFFTSQNQIEIETLCINGILKAESISFDGYKFVKIEKTITKNQVANNISFFDDCDYVIVKKYSETYQQIPAKTFIAHNSEASTENLILLNDYSSWTLN